MPHLSPMKWFSMYIIMISWTLMFLIKMNYLFIYMPQKNIKTLKTYKLMWKL